MVSGAQTDHNNPFLQKARMDYFIEKPFKINELASLIAPILSVDFSCGEASHDPFINAAFADDLLRLSMELLHAHQSPNADPKRILHSIHGIAGMLEQDKLRTHTARLMALDASLTETHHLPTILHIVHQCENAAHKLTLGHKPHHKTKIAL